MSPELVELLLKAVRSLSQEEQDQVLRELIGAGIELTPVRSSVSQPAGPAPTVTMFGFQRQNTARLREALAGEGSGPQWLAGALNAPFSVVAGMTRRYPHLGITLCIVIAT